MEETAPMMGEVKDVTMNMMEKKDQDQDDDEDMDCKCCYCSCCHCRKKPICTCCCDWTMYCLLCTVIPLGILLLLIILAFI